MHNGPLVSVVIPAHNCAEYLNDTLESVLGQSYQHVEIVVVDDGSTDETPDVISRFRDRIVHTRQANGGLAAARNAGMRLASGELIAWLDADDLCALDRLLVQAAYMTYRPTVVAVATNFRAFDTSGIFDEAHARRYYSEIGESGLGTLFPGCESFDGAGVEWLERSLPKAYCVYFGSVWKRLVLGNFLHPPTIMIRRSARELVGWVGCDFRGAEDWEYLIRLAHEGPVAFIDESLLDYRYHAGQMSSPENGLRSALSNVRVLESTLARHAGSLADIREQLDRSLATFHREAAYFLAESEPRRALGHLLHAVRLDPRRARIGFNLLRILLSQGGVLRRLRAEALSKSTRR